jgi:predicted secreted protein
MTNLEIGPSASGTAIKVAIGAELHLTLPETRTAGYNWHTVSAESPVFFLKDAGFTPAKGVGGTGVHRWALSAMQKGTATLELVHARSWESPSQAKQRFTVTIEVK